MNVLVDTSVWSLALRRRGKADPAAIEQLRRLVDEGRVAIVGPIRQELLSGVAVVESFERLRAHLRAFPDVVLDAEDFERAAEHYNACRRRGVLGSNTDFLMCAVAERRGFPILTRDEDFTRFAEILPITLYGRPRQ